MYKVRPVSRVPVKLNMMPAVAIWVPNASQQFILCMQHQKTLDGKKECYLAYRDAISEDE